MTITFNDLPSITTCDYDDENIVGYIISGDDYIPTTEVPTDTKVQFISFEDYWG